MDYKPTDEERDWVGVCAKCGQMSKTKIIDLLGTPEKMGQRLKDLFIDIETADDDTIEANMHDYREVTRCCESEDFIPEIYAALCKTCRVWYDERRGKKCSCS